VTIWDQVLEELRAGMPAEDFQRWFGSTAYASDSGDQITVWVPSEAIRRHLDNQYRDAMARAIASVGRSSTSIRLVVSGFEDDELDEE
jgi:chromosomal replication initiation ATPase DnaA